MRAVLGTIVVMLLTVGLAAHADTTYNIYTFNGSQTSGSVMIGDTVDLWVQATTDDSLVGVRYDVLLPTDDWSLTAHDYNTYGWKMNDGLFDNSVPLETASYPIAVTNTLYDTTLTDPDFHLETVRSDFEPLPTGTCTMGDFSLLIPSDTPLGSYTISLRNLYAYEADGTPIGVSAGYDFLLEVTEIPEPATLALFALGLAGLGARLRRRS